MNPLTKLMVERQARQDAESGIDTSDDAIIAAVGPRPEYDPAANYRDRRFATALANRADLEEERDDERRRMDGLTRQPNVVGLFTGLSVTVVAEVFGNILLLKSLGIQGSARWLGAVGLSVGLIFVTRALSTSDVEGAPKAGRSFIVRIVYLVLVVAIALARIGGFTGADDDGVVMMGAELVIMIALTVFPGFLGERFLRQLVPALTARKELKTTQRRIKRLERSHGTADAYLQKVSEQQRKWDREAAQWRAVYRAAHRRTQKGGRIEA